MDTFERHGKVQLTNNRSFGFGLGFGFGFGFGSGVRIRLCGLGRAG